MHSKTSDTPYQIIVFVRPQKIRPFTHYLGTTKKSLIKLIKSNDYIVADRLLDVEYAYVQRLKSLLNRSTRQGKTPWANIRPKV